MSSRGTSTSAGAPPQDDFCSICHDTFTLPCQANCAHWFCGDCILRVWQDTSADARSVGDGRSPQPCRCPICRRSINLLFTSHFEKSEDPEAQRVLRAVEDYNENHGRGPVSSLEHVQDIPLLLRRLAQDLLDLQTSLSLGQRARIIFYLMLMIIYVLSPVDLLPEAFLGFFGLIDDIFVALYGSSHVAGLYRSALVHRRGR